jgi:arylsulfatase A-like enzyme
LKRRFFFEVQICKLLTFQDHTAVEGGHYGFDMRRNLSVAHDLHGQYTTDVITQESVRLIRQHNTSTPLFLYVAHAAMHSANPYNPLPAADADVNRFAQIENYNRRKYAAMLYRLDASVGEIVQTLRNMDMLSNSIIVFSSDNGGPAEGFNLNAASNWPLRGVKNTLWEGGVRGAGLLFSPLLKQPQRVANQTMHIVDWLPTLWAAIGGGDGWVY